MNPTWLASIQIFGGLVGLVIGGELLVRGASRLARAFRISPLLIGLTVVSFGTSAPELAVSLQAIYSDSDSVAVGNVIGSNIFNVLFVLGGSALIVPLLVSSQLVRRDVPLMIAASVLMWYFCADGSLERWEGGGLFVILLGYLYWSFRESNRESEQVKHEFEQGGGASSNVKSSLIFDLIYIVAGLAALAIGAQQLVQGASSIALSWGIDELVIGLTVVAIGTSLPEAVTSLVAAIRGEREIAVGNVVGSNLFNILAVLGISGLLAPRAIPVPVEAIWFDIPIMVVVAFACYPIFATGNLIRRWEGALFLLYLTLYLAMLVLDAIDSSYLVSLKLLATLLFVPLTIITIGVSVWQSIRARTWNTPMVSKD